MNAGADDVQELPEGVLNRLEMLEREVEEASDRATAAEHRAAAAEAKLAEAAKRKSEPAEYRSRALGARTSTIGESTKVRTKNGGFFDPERFGHHVGKTVRAQLDPMRARIEALEADVKTLLDLVAEQDAKGRRHGD